MIHIRKRLGMLACAAALSLCGAAHATTFDLSYAFNPDPDGVVNTLTGTFEGTLNGATIDDVSDLQLWLDGVAFVGPLQITTWNTMAFAFDTVSTLSIQLDSSLDNFAVTDSSFLSFGIVNDPALGGAQIYAYNFETGVYAADQGNNGSLSIIAVPEPASLALMLAGLCVVGIAARRRSA